MFMHARIEHLTLGSARGPGVWTCTTRCTNLIQQIRTPGVTVSHILKIFNFMADMVSHVEDSDE